jgi:hypothetical protein
MSTSRNLIAAAAATAVLGMGSLAGAVTIQNGDFSQILPHPTTPGAEYDSTHGTFGTGFANWGIRSVAVSGPAGGLQWGVQYDTPPAGSGPHTTAWSMEGGSMNTADPAFGGWNHHMNFSAGRRLGTSDVGPKVAFVRAVDRGTSTGADPNRSELWQTVTGLTPGQEYVLNFDYSVSSRINVTNTVQQAYVFATLEPSVSAYHLAFSPQGDLFVTGPTTSSFDCVYRIDPQLNEVVAKIPYQGGFMYDMVAEESGVWLAQATARCTPRGPRCTQRHTPPRRAPARRGAREPGG